MRGRKNLLLIELIAVIFFFSISTVVTLQVFSEAYRQSRMSIRKTYALIDIESWAERISKAEDIDGLFQEWNGSEEDSPRRLERDDGYYLTMEYVTEITDAGTIIRFTLSAYDAMLPDAPLLLSMPVSRYLPEAGEST